ncbi:MAG: ferric reductase-like transmembrane domain-containing protein [Ahrensia sp.]
MSRLRFFAIWFTLAGIVLVAVSAAAASPLLAYREPVYIAAGLAGVVALAAMLFQPLLAGDELPGLSPLRGRRLHRLIGASLVSLVTLHVAALWITSPPDVVDALLFRSPTWFSVWGVVAMWAVFATGLLYTRRTKMRPRTWRRFHTALAIIIVAATISHAMLIDGTMEAVSKIVLCTFVGLATLRLVIKRRLWAAKR